MSDETGERRAWWRPGWAWVPFVGIGIVIVVNMLLLRAAGGVTTDSVAGDPYEDARRIDQDKLAAQRFAEAGLELRVAAIDGRPHLILEGDRVAGLGPVQVAWYRPSGAEHDREQVWERPGEPLATDIGPGLWFVTLVGELEGEPVRVRRSVTW